MVGYNNCEKCIHKAVCNLRPDYMLCIEVASEKSIQEDFSIYLYCNHFRTESNGTPIGVE